MPRELTACEIDSIMVGATFLGAGGGGPLDTGRELLKKQTSGSYSIDLYSMDEIPEKERDATYGRLFGFSAKDQGEWYLWSRWSGVL